MLAKWDCIRSCSVCGVDNPEATASLSSSKSSCVMTFRKGDCRKGDVRTGDVRTGDFRKCEGSVMAEHHPERDGF